MYQHFFKRLLDFLLSLIGLLIISPLLLFIWMLLRIANGNAGAYFIQERPGKGGRLFRVIKFKTMDDKRDGAGNLLPVGERITSVGRGVRSLSIDELPQLINVMKGDMRLVGPRPLLMQYFPLYTERQARGSNTFRGSNNTNKSIISLQIRNQIPYLQRNSKI